MANDGRASPGRRCYRMPARTPRSAVSRGRRGSRGTLEAVGTRSSGVPAALPARGPGAWRRSNLARVQSRKLRSLRSSSESRVLDLLVAPQHGRDALRPRELSLGLDPDAVDVEQRAVGVEEDGAKRAGDGESGGADMTPDCATPTERLPPPGAAAGIRSRVAARRTRRAQVDPTRRERLVRRAWRRRRTSSLKLGLRPRRLRHLARRPDCGRRRRRREAALAGRLCALRPACRRACFAAIAVPAAARRHGAVSRRRWRPWSRLPCAAKADADPEATNARAAAMLSSCFMRSPEGSDRPVCRGGRPAAIGACPSVAPARRLEEGGRDDPKGGDQKLRRGLASRPCADAGAGRAP